MENNPTNPTQILVVDAQPGSAETLRDILDAADYHITIQASADDARAHLQTRGLPEVALLADNLPNDDALKLCRSLHSRDHDLPVLILADSPDDAAIDAIFAAGAADCILRPVHPGLLRRHVRTQVERRRMQRELDHREERYDTIAHLASDYAYEMEVHPDGRMATLWMTENFATLTGYTRAEMGQPDFWQNLVLADDLPVIEKRVQTLLQGKQNISEFRLRAKDGRILWVSDHAYPLWDSHAGRVVHLYGIGRDITDLRRLNTAMLNSQETLELALDAGEIGIWDWNMVTNNTYFSPGWLRMLGYTPDELDGNFEVWRDRIHPDDLPRVLAALEQHTQHGRPYSVEHRLKAKDGGWRWIQARGKIVARDETDTPVRMAGIHRDIDERRRAEEAFALSEQRHRIISETISDYAYSYIVEPDYSLKKDWSTQAFHDITGYTFEEMDADGWERLVYPEDRPLAEARFARLLKGEVDITEFRIVTKTGEIRWLRDHGHPVIDEDTGRVVHIYGAAQDITQRKHDEEKLREQAEELRARNEELDAFAYSVAHDLKNPIASMMGFASLVQKYYERMDGQTVQEYIGLIMESGYKLKQIINALLMLAGVSKMEQAEIEPLDMSVIVDDATRRLAYMIEEAGVEVRTPGDWPVAVGYGPWIEEVWTNYISNALKYGGTPPSVEVGANAEGDGMVRFWVKDNGQGLTAEEQARVFTPFERLNQVQVEGHGLGLSLVQRIVLKLGGDVSVESTPGAGSTFSFTLPAANS